MSAAPPPPDFWQSSPQRAAALHCALKLVQRMLTPWPRRGHKLLLLGVGDVFLLPLLWEAGFDVTGVDSNPARIAQARQRMGDRVELAVGAPEHTSYGGNSFDFVVIPPLPAAPQEQREALGAVLAEAVRLAARGLLAAFWNPCSLAGMGRARPDHRLHSLHKSTCWLPCAAYTQALRELAPQCRMCGRSCLCTPPTLWAASAPDGPSRDFQPESATQAPPTLPRIGLRTRLADALNTLFCPLPLGALGVLRADFTAGTPLTGLPLRLNSLGDNLGLMPRPATEAAEASMKRKLPPRQSEDICPQ